MKIIESLLKQEADKLDDVPFVCFFLKIDHKAMWNTYFYKDIKSKQQNLSKERVVINHEINDEKRKSYQ